MGISLRSSFPSRLFVVAILAFLLGMQPFAMAFATQDPGAIETHATTSHDDHNGHSSIELSGDQSTHCPDAGSILDCGKAGCGGMHCDSHAFIFAHAVILHSASDTQDTLVTVTGAGFGFEPPVQPPRL